MKLSLKKSSAREQTAGEMLRNLRPTACKAGLPPGTPIHIGEQLDQDVVISVTDYDAENCSLRVVPPDEDMGRVASGNASSVTWLNVSGLHQVGVIEKICNGFHIHPLVQEDILNTTQRPKVDVFDGYVFIVVKMHSVAVQENFARLDLEQISFLLGENFLITFQEQKSPIFDQVSRRLVDNKGRIRKMGPDYLAYA
ncbi:MAG: CorA family divalent cation transporter, partial [Desulfobulbaceae bacterium]|nr:CorA family divalent cation transporter [Desulfobulbaceae bacterium]